MVEFGLHLTTLPVSDLVKAGVLAERHGFSSVWVPDHYTDMPPSGDMVDPWVVLSAIGVQTERIRLSTDVTDVYRVHPTKIAHIVATLDELTKGRAMVGIGAGEAMNVRAYGMPWADPDTRVERLREGIDVIRLMWRSSRDSPVSYTGRFYRLEGAWMDQKPIQRYPAIYIGALGARRMLRLVGQVADGWKPWIGTPELYRRRLSIIEEAAREAGRDPEEIDRIAFIYTAITEDEALLKEAIDAIKPEIIMLTHRRALKELGFEVPIPRERDYSYQRAPPVEEVVSLPREAAREMPDEVAKKFLAVGRPDEVIEGIERFLNAGARNVVVKDLIGLYVKGEFEAFKEQIRLFGDKIIPYFKG